MTTATSALVGTGWAFPLGINANGGIRIVGGVDEIEQAIFLVLATSPGERPMRPDFGCGLVDFVFEPVEPSTFGRIAAAVEDSLRRWEPRIDLDDVTVAPDPACDSALLIAVTYRIRDTYDRRSLVVPFYVIADDEESVTP